MSKVTHLFALASHVRSIVSSITELSHVVPELNTPEGIAVRRDIVLACAKSIVLATSTPLDDQLLAKLEPIVRHAAAPIVLSKLVQLIDMSLKLADGKPVATMIDQAAADAGVTA